MMASLKFEKHFYWQGIFEHESPYATGPLPKAYYALEAHRRFTLGGSIMVTLVCSFLKIFSVHTDILFQKPELTKGFYKKAYNGLFQEYYTDRYYLAVGNVEKEQGKRGLNLVTAIIIRSRPETRDGSKGEHNGSNF